MTCARLLTTRTGESDVKRLDLKIESPNFRCCCDAFFLRHSICMIHECQSEIQEMTPSSRRGNRRHHVNRLQHKVLTTSGTSMTPFHFLKARESIWNFELSKYDLWLIRISLNTIDSDSQAFRWQPVTLSCSLTTIANTDIMNTHFAYVAFNDTRRTSPVRLKALEGKMQGKARRSRAPSLLLLASLAWAGAAWWLVTIAHWDTEAHAGMDP